eukprot:15345289-Alexandrium_andersonii.AAC.1
MLVLRGGVPARLEEGIEGCPQQSCPADWGTHVPGQGRNGGVRLHPARHPSCPPASAVAST